MMSSGFETLWGGHGLFTAKAVESFVCRDSCLEFKEGLENQLNHSHLLCSHVLQLPSQKIASGEESFITLSHNYRTEWFSMNF